MLLNFQPAPGLNQAQRNIPAFVQLRYTAQRVRENEISIIKCILSSRDFPLFYVIINSYETTAHGGNPEKVLTGPVRSGG